MTTDRLRYWPGDLAPISGIYRIVHRTAHRPPHEALMIRGEELPPCRVCKTAVSFEVVHPTSHTTHDWDFAGPSALVVRSRPLDLREIRGCHRYNLDLPIVVALGRSSQATRIGGHTLDIGEGGVSATMEGPLVSCKPVSIQIALPGSLGSLVVNARLRHARGLRHGFQFTRMRKDGREALRQILE
jgi:PilZ domain